MNIAFTVFGALIGFAEFFLLKKTVENITAGKKTFLFFILLKLLVYAGSVCLIMTVFKGYIVWAGIGLAVGMFTGAIINFAVSVKSNNKGDDKA